MSKKLNIIKTDKPFWFFTDQADEDYISARLLSCCGNTLWHVAAYHSHQAVEKYIKSYLVQEKKEYPDTHNLKAIGKLAEELNAIFIEEKTKQQLELFDQFEQVSRYGGFAKYDPSSVRTQNYTIVGGFAWTDSNIRQLDELVFNIRGLLDFSSKPTLDNLKSVLNEDSKIGFVSDWKLPTLSIKQVLTQDNQYFKR